MRACVGPNPAAPSAIRAGRAAVRIGRVVLLGACLGGCLGTGGGSGRGSRPAVIPLLSELPGDPEKRNTILDQANTTPGPEHRKPAPLKQVKAETTAATVAAIIGGMFSKTQNVTLGSSSSFDENLIVAPPPPPVRSRPAPDPATEPEVTTDNSDLVPWIRLK